MTEFHMSTSGPWSLGALIWLPICAVIVLVLLAVAVFALKEIEGQRAPGLGFGCIAGAAVFIIGTALPVVGMYPYAAEYHQWREVSGTVEKIDKRLIGSGDGMEEKFVVRFADSDGAQFGCDDTRCASVAAGDDLTLSCKRAWQYTGTDGYDCRFVSTESATIGGSL